MLNFCEFIEFMKELSSHSNSLQTQDISYLAHKKLAIDVQVIANLFIESLSRSSEATVHSVAEEYISKLRKAQIQPVFVFGGIEFFELADKNSSASLFKTGYWNLRKRFFEANLLSETSKRREEINRVKRLHKINISVHVRQIEMWMDESLSDYFIGQKIDFIKSPQLRESQLASLYKEGYIDWIVGGVLTTILSDVPNVIESINFDNGTFTFFSFELLQKALNFQDTIFFQEILKVCMCLFKLDTKFHKSFNLVKSFKDTSLNEIFRAQKTFTDETIVVFLSMIEKLREQLQDVDFNDRKAVVEKVSPVVDVDLEKLAELLEFIDDPVSFSLSNYSITGMKGKSKYSLNVDSEELLYLFSLNLVSLKFLGLFSKNFKNEYRREIESAESRANFNIIFKPFLISLCGAIRSCFQFYKNQTREFRLFAMGIESSFCMRPRPPKELSSFICHSKEPRLSSVLKEFAIHRKTPERFLTLNREQALSQKTIVQHLCIKFLDTHRLISLQKRELTPVGLIFSRFTDSCFFENLLYFYFLMVAGAADDCLKPSFEEESPAPSLELGNATSEVKPFNSWDAGIVSFKKSFLRNFPESKVGDSFGELSVEEKSQVRLMLRVMELIRKYTFWNGQSDYDLYQFAYCFYSMRDTFNFTISGELLNLLFNSGALDNLSQIDGLILSLPFERLSLQGCSTLLSIWLGRFIAYRKLLAAGIDSRDSIIYISIPYMKQCYNISFDLFSFITDARDFARTINRFMKEALASKKEEFRPYYPLFSKYFAAFETFEDFYFVVSCTSNLVVKAL